MITAALRLHLCSAEKASPYATFYSLHAACCTITSGLSEKKPAKRGLVSQASVVLRLLQYTILQGLTEILQNQPFVMS